MWNVVITLSLLFIVKTDVNECVLLYHSKSIQYSQYKLLYMSNVAFLLAYRNTIWIVPKVMNELGIAFLIWIYCLNK